MDRLSTKGQMIDQIDLREVPHSGFDRSNHNYGSAKLGAIVPTRLDEVYPGDRIKGTPQMVANFEPLAAPLMGSMVLKQESFYVPYNLLWRHAYKFFSGKDGFDEVIPSISPSDIYRIYNDNILGVLYTYLGDDSSEGLSQIVFSLSSFYASTPDVIYSDVSQTGDTFYNDLKALETAFIAIQHAIYGGRKMIDLIQPIINYVHDFVESNTIKEISVKFETANGWSKTDDILPLSGLLGGFMKTIHQFFFGESSLFDYLGWPITTDDSFKISAPIPQYGVTDLFSLSVYRNILIWGSHVLNDNLEEKFSSIPLNFLPFKAYYLCWYWNYRDQLLETGILDPEEDEFLGSDITENVVLYCTIMRQRCWFKDAFTTALTNTGDGNLLVPTDTPDAQLCSFAYYDAEENLIHTTDHAQAVAAGATVCEVTSSGYKYKVPMNYLSTSFDNYSPEVVNYNGYVSLDMFDRIQRLRTFMQKKLILGYEVDDVIWSSFMVRLSNVRMHIPELLGRGRDSVEISTLVNNTSTDQQIAGDKTATAWCKGSISEVNYFSEEWGFYLQFATILPIQSYAGGLQRLYLKRDRFDYMWPEFATMGMDAVYNCELTSLTNVSDSEALLVFGYQGRYYDLKYRQDEEHGRLRSDLNYLTFSREFDSDHMPRLNYIFVHCWPRLDGFVIESPLVDVFRYDCYTAQGWERRLPVPSQFVH